MSGWNNPLPIGLSICNPVGEGGRTSEDGGIRYSRLPSNGGVIAPIRGVCGPPKHIPLQLPRDPRITNFPSSHSLRSCFPQLAFWFFPHLPPLSQMLAPSLPLGDISVATIPAARAAKTPTNASASRTSPATNATQTMVGHVNLRVDFSYNFIVLSLLAFSS